MSDVIIGYKWVLDEADLRIKEDLSVDFSMAKGKISEYDKNAIEAGNQLAQHFQGKAIGVTCGGDPAKKSMVDALARGLDECILLNTQDADPHAHLASRFLAEMAKRKNVGLVICAEGSSDDYARQTAPRVGAVLDWPVITSVSSFEVQDEKLLLERKVGDVIQVLKVSLPAVIAVLPEACPAPIPNLKAVLAAKKKTTEEIDAALVGVSMESTIERSETKGYVNERKCVILNNDSVSEAATALLAALKKEGVL